MEKADCLRIEEQAFNAWPGIQHALCNGWLMRFAHGYTRRANSVVPLYDGDIAVAPKVAACRAHYARRDPAQRNRGYGRQLVARLCSWGKARGAHRAYLQVIRENDIARRLYSRLGFAEAYHYWYRVESI